MDSIYYRWQSLLIGGVSQELQLVDAFKILSDSFAKTNAWISIMPGLLGRFTSNSQTSGARRPGEARLVYEARIVSKCLL